MKNFYAVDFKRSGALAVAVALLGVFKAIVFKAICRLGSKRVLLGSMPVFFLSTLVATAAFVDKESLTKNLILELAGSGEGEVVIKRDSLYEMGAFDKPVYYPYVDATLNSVVLPMEVLFAKYPEMDHALAYCYDGYVSYYTPEFVAEYEPFIVLEIEGNEKGDLQLEGAPDLGPFYITFEKPLVQGAAEMPDPDNKRPFGVYKIELGTRDVLVGDLYKGPMARLTPIEAQGRELWLNNCMSCHSWDTDETGGNLSNRTAKLLSIHARFNKKYFHDFIRNPEAMIPNTKMPKHPHYTNAQIESIRSFLKKIPD
jgi:hypothetical protein